MESLGKSASSPSNAHPPRASEWDPRTYPEFTATVEHYEDLQAAVVDVTRGSVVRRILDLGTGTGETARRLLCVHKDATLVGVDANRSMLDAAAASLPHERTTLLQGWVEAPLPPGPFDLIVSVLAVHHVDSLNKAVLFAKIRDALAPGGRFVLGDVVLSPEISEGKEAAAARLRRSVRDRGAVGTGRAIALRVWRKVMPAPTHSGGQLGQDQPDLLSDQVSWLIEAGLHVEVVWEKDSLAVITADKLMQH